MGVDLRMTVTIGPQHRQITEDDFLYIREQFRAAFHYEEIKFSDGSVHGWPDLKRDDDNPNRIDVSTAHSYFGPDYPRGHWPEIRDKGDFLANWFGASTIGYGSDHDDDFSDPGRPWLEMRKVNEALWEQMQEPPSVEASIAGLLAIREETSQ